MRAVIGSGLLAALVLLLLGCTHEPLAPLPAIVAKPVVVYIPVATKCISQADVLGQPPSAQLTGDSVQDEAILSETDLALRAVLDHDLALIGGCTK